LLAKAITPSEPTSAGLLVSLLYLIDGIDIAGAIF
jgi:hypothetical protein